MRASLLQTLFALGALTALFTGCSQSNADDVFDLKVELLYASPDCDDDPDCWLPTQLQPELTAGESISNEWPVKGDTVQVLCQTTGESIQNYAGEDSEKWFGIKVPTDRLGVDTTTARPVEGGYLGYVSSVWMAQTPNRAPAC